MENRPDQSNNNRRRSFLETLKGDKVEIKRNVNVKGLCAEGGEGKFVGMGSVVEGTVFVADVE